MNRPSQPALTSSGASLRDATPQGAAVSFTYVRPSRHPSFCDEILGLFPEENVKGWFSPNFMDCDSLRSAVARSFDTWAANHKKIYFTDVTAQCTNATDNVCAAAEVCVSTPRCPMYRLQTHQTLLTTTY